MDLALKVPQALITLKLRSILCSAVASNPRNSSPDELRRKSRKRRGSNAAAREWRREDWRVKFQMNSSRPIKLLFVDPNPKKNPFLWVGILELDLIKLITGAG